MEDKELLRVKEVIDKAVEEYSYAESNPEYSDYRVKEIIEDVSRYDADMSEEYNSEFSIESQTHIIEEHVSSLTENGIDDFVRKCNAIQGRIFNLKKEEERLASERKHLEAVLAKIKMFSVAGMIKYGITLLKGKAYSMFVRYTPSVVIDNMEAIPKEYIRTKTEVSADKIALKKALADGTIPGCHIEKNASLQLK